MKHFFTLIALVVALTATAQVTITQSSFPRQANFNDTVPSTNVAGLTFPTEGADQVWDYSGLTPTNMGYGSYTDASSSVDFPNALHSSPTNLNFQIFSFPGTNYDAVDSLGWYAMGRTIDAAGFSIAAISGGADDSLKFPEQVLNFGGRLNLVQFPMTYQTSWTGSQTEVTEFELTVAAASLNNTPGSQNRLRTDEREVVGYGKLIIPNAAGNPSDSLDALLVKTYRTIQDSFFIGGSAAPQALLTTFGLTQGSTRVDTFYIMYSPGFGAPVMNINVTGNNVTSIFYRPAAAGISSSISEVADLQVGCYPNPAIAGNTVVIEANTGQATATQVSIIDLQGKRLNNLALDAPQANRYSFALPETLPMGIFILQLQDANGNTVGLTKLMVE